jgi:hypothetical protein
MRRNNLIKYGLIVLIASTATVAAGGGQETVINDIGAQEDTMETLLAAAGDTTVKEDLLKFKQYGDKNFKVHLDGYNLLPAFRARPPGRGTSSSTGPTMAASLRCAITTGR